MKRLYPFDTVTESQFDVIAIENFQCYQRFDREIEKEYGENHMYLALLTEALIEKRIYTLCAPSSSHTNNLASIMNLSHSKTQFVLPCCCVLSAERDDTITFVWTASSARRRGLAAALLRGLAIQYKAWGIGNDELNDFWTKCHIRTLYTVKAPVKETHAITVADEFYDACDERELHDIREPHVVITYMIWLLKRILEHNDDVAVYIGLFLFKLHEAVHFHAIMPEYYDMIYNDMPERRIERQKAKGKLLALISPIEENVGMFGQFSGDDARQIVANRTMIIARYYDSENAPDFDTNEALRDTFASFLKSIAYRLQFRTTQLMLNGVTFHYIEQDPTIVQEFHAIEALAEAHQQYYYRGLFSKGTFIVVMDTGINRQAALAYAKKIVEMDDYLCAN